MNNTAHVATRKGLFTLKRQKGTWQISQSAFVGDNVQMVLRDPRDGTVYAALGHGHFGVKLHRSTDGGNTFTEIATPQYPPKPPELVELDSVRQTPIEWTTQIIWALEAGGADQPGVIWAGTAPGGLFRSQDRGESWTICESLWRDPARSRWMGGGLDWPAIHSICVDPRNANHIHIGVSCGGVWITRDGGKTFQVGGKGMYAEFMPPDLQMDPGIQDPHRLVACPARPEVMYVQHHNGCFKSTDGAASWTEIKNIRPSKFGFAVVVHPKDPDTAWFVPAVKDEKRYPVEAKVVVARTRDGGESFDVLTKGLPQQNAYDLIFRHALDIDSSGNGLMMGSTTGNLWYSEDQGDSWQTISNHLPPVYAVRFA